MYTLRTQGLVASIIEYKPADPWAFVLSIVTETCPKLADDPQAIISKLIEGAVPEAIETASLPAGKETAPATGSTEADGKENVDSSNEIPEKDDAAISDEAVLMYLNQNSVYTTFKDIMTALAESQPEAPYASFVELVERKVKGEETTDSPEMMDEGDVNAAEEGGEGELPENTTIVFVLGGPGSGKGTQCDRIVAEYGFTHLSAGDLLREEVASGSETGQMCEQLMTEGKLVPMQVTIALIKAAMVKSKSSLFLIDGFPRALDQGHEFESTIKACSLILFFDCPLETMQDRLLKRAETSGRSDDNIETIKKRFTTFTESSMPVIEHYEALDKVAKISAVPAPDEVYASVKGILESKFPDLAAAEPEAEAAPEAVSEPEVAPEAVSEPEVAPEAVPEAASEATPEPEVAPEGVDDTGAEDSAPAAEQSEPEAAEEAPTEEAEPEA